MARSRQRSLRFEDEHGPFIDSLPAGTVNTFFNELLRIFKEDESLQSRVRLTDERFRDWKMPEKGAENVEKMVSEKAKTPVKSALPVAPPPPKPKPTEPEIGVGQVGDPIESEVDPLIAGTPFDPKKAKEQEEIAAVVDGAAEFDKALNISSQDLHKQAEELAAEVQPAPAPVDEPVKTVEKPAPAPAPTPAAKSALSDLFPGL